MVNVTAAMVKALREVTGAGVMDCKRALIEAEGNQELAVENLRKAGLAMAAKKAGRIAAEGEAMGRIVVASNIGGSLENLKDGITGKHFEAGNADSLAEALRWALNLSEDERKKIGQAATEFVKENFTKQIMCDKTLAVYRELINMD